MQYVYVLNKHGEPLMPCSPGKARILLKQQKACVVKRTPFTIKLLYGSAGYKQPITLGVDAGSKHVGLSASTEKRELYSEEFTPRNDVVELLSTRRQNRRSRRNRKTHYRAPRFNNRIHSKHKGWLAPSVEVKIQEHITVIKRICRILPITLVRVETAEFDTQRLKAMLAGKPLPVGTDYQLGEMYDEYNVRQYVLKRDHYTCQCCGAHNTAEKVVKLHVHHLESRKTGGNAPSNLVTLCTTCHKNLHKGKVTLDGKERDKPLRDAAFMGIMRKTLMARLKEELPIPVQGTYGYITKMRREQNDIKKAIQTMLVVLASIHWLNLAAFATVQRLSDTIIGKLIKQISLKSVSVNGAKCLISLKGSVFGIRSSTKGKNASFPDVALRGALRLKSWMVRVSLKA